MVVNSGVRARVHAAGKVLEGDDRQTDTPTHRIRPLCDDYCRYYLMYACICGCFSVKRITQLDGTAVSATMTVSRLAHAR